MTITTMMTVNVVLALLLVVGIVAGYFEWQRGRAQVAAAERATVEALDLSGRTLRLAVEAESDLFWERIQHVITQAERDRYQTALRAKFEQEARAELLNPDEPVGVATVVEFKAAGR